MFNPWPVTCGNGRPSVSVSLLSSPPSLCSPRPPAVSVSELRRRWTYTPSLHVRVCISEWRLVWQDLLNITEDHKPPNMPIVTVPCGVSVYVPSLIFRHSAWNVHVYVCVCVFYVADLKLFNGNAFLCCCTFSSSKILQCQNKYSAHGSVMPHLSLFVCVCDVSQRMRADRIFERVETNIHDSLLDGVQSTTEA